MSSYLRNNFIFHENRIDNLSYQQNLLFFNKKPMSKINNLEKIKEPSIPVYDRQITGRNKVIKLTKKEEIDYIKNNINNNEREINITDKILFKLIEKMKLKKLIHWKKVLILKKMKKLIKGKKRKI